MQLFKLQSALTVTFLFNFDIGTKIKNFKFNFQPKKRNIKCQYWGSKIHVRMSIKQDKKLELGNQKANFNLSVKVNMLI